MKTSDVIHAVNQIIDWVKQHPANPDRDRSLAALAAIKQQAVDQIATEDAD